MGFLFGQTGFESHERREIYSDMLHSFVKTFKSIEGVVWGWTLPRRKWLRVIINDNFLEEGKC